MSTHQTVEITHVKHLMEVQELMLIQNLMLDLVSLVNKVLKLIL